jgi:pyridoxal phosphate enzyme (YggS family)
MSIAENIEKLRERIENAARKVERDPSEIKLLAVTKTHPIPIIEEAIKHGIEYIGENRIQEAVEKIPFLKDNIREFHFIGHLQSNKIKKLMKLEPALIHSIDKLSTARKLNEHLGELKKKQDILIQVNTSAEASKFGIDPQETVPFVQEIAQLKNLQITGLMTIGMFTSDETIIRKCFQTLRRLFEEIKRENIPGVKMKFLSMGMTDDFEIALEEGANIIRIGSAIFGARNY